MFKLLKWFDVGTNWRLGIDRFIRFCCILILVNWFLNLLYTLPAKDSKSLVDFIISKVPIGGS